MELRRIRVAAAAICLFGICTVLNAQDRPVAAKKHLLWRVSSKQNSIYLLGSIHLLKEENYPLPDVIDKAFEGSATAVFEVDIAEMQRPENAQRMLLKALLPAGKTLEAELGKETYARLKGKAAGMGLELGALGQFRPWYVGILISMVKLQQLGFAQGYGVDRHYHAGAVKAKKEVVGLETGEYAIDVLAELAGEKPDEFMNQVLDDLDIIEKQMAEIVKAWFAGDTKSIEDTILKSFKDHPGIYKALVIERNRKWLPKIEQFLKGQKKHFVCVGTAHVVGKDSLLDLLRKKGYTVEQL
jgi:uncharacterized protein YbaP (TraB family)